MQLKFIVLVALTMQTMTVLYAIVSAMRLFRANHSGLCFKG